MAVDENCAGIAARETLALFGGKVDCGVELELYKVGSRRHRATRSIPDYAVGYGTWHDMMVLFCWGATSACWRHRCKTVAA